MIELTKGENSSIDAALNGFLKSIEQEKNIRFMEEKVTYKTFFNNRMLIVYSIRNGIPYSLFQEIRETTPFTESDWASFLNLSTKSLQRYKQEKEHIFKPIHSEKIIELAEVTNLGREVFDTVEQFYLWLNSPSVALGNLKPLELLKDSYGKELVISELNRIDQGIFV
jgi:putative toxin-antitoxin system antitoxin component (TIGR02293 family)